MHCKSCDKCLNKLDYIIDPRGEFCKNCMSTVYDDLQEFKKDNKVTTDICIHQNNKKVGK